MRSVWLNALPSSVLVLVMVDVDVTVPEVIWALSFWPATLTVNVAPAMLGCGHFYSFIDAVSRISTVMTEPCAPTSTSVGGPTSVTTA
jgi:hypothetical protein